MTDGIFMLVVGWLVCSYWYHHFIIYGGSVVHSFFEASSSNEMICFSSLCFVWHVESVASLSQ